MIRHDVFSSNIASIGYDREAQVLEVAFKPNRHDEAQVRQYEGVPADVYETLSTANEKHLSLGSFFHHQIRDRYRNRQVAVIISGSERSVPPAEMP